MKSKSKKYLSSVTLLLIAIFLLFNTFPSAAAFTETDDENVLKVGYYEDGDFMSQNQLGEYVGYNIEFLQDIARQSGHLLKIVDTGSWDAAYDMLLTGEIDILPAVYFSDERSREVLFVPQPMCNLYTTLNVRMDDERYDYENFEAFEDMNVGIIKDSLDGDRFREFCQEHQIRLNIIDYSKTSQLLQALDDGTLDGIAITHMGKNNSLRCVAEFSLSPLYIAVSKKRVKLQEDLGKAIDVLLLNNPNYTTELYDKYLSPGLNQKPVFSKAEKQYMKEIEPLIVSYDPDFAPLSYEEIHTGKYKGITADIFDFIEENSGLRFKFEAHSQPEGLRLLNESKVDILAVSDGDHLWNEKNYINSTLHYLRSPTSVITRNNSEKRNVLALLEGYELSEAVKKDYPDSSILYYPSVSQCLTAVCRGDADAAYINTQVARFFLDEMPYRELDDTTLSAHTNRLRIGFSSSADPLLFSILNKCIRYLPADQMDEFIIKNSVSAKHVTLAEFMQLHMWEVLLSIFLVLGIIILLITYNLKNALNSNRKIQDLLYKDSLTGLNSLNGFIKAWDSLARDGKQSGYALLYGDICQFKFINDSFGFTTGNHVLLAYGQILSESLKPDEFCGRVSADNFVLLMHYDTWEHLIERLNTCMYKLEQWRTENTEILYKIDFVFGVCLTEQAKSTDIHQLMDLANYARRHAKNTPGSFAVLYGEQMRQEAVIAKQLEDSLERALSENEFEVYYQPKVSMADGQIVGCEALIRWNHPEKGFLMPSAFIPLFEKNGMIKKMDFWLFEMVCHTMQLWEDRKIKRLPVSCNFSRLHFKENDFPERICRISDRYQIPRHLLEIEITESALIENPEIIVSSLYRLKKLGYQISIDDFGSGYSSLGQLQQLSANILKLDRSFVCHGVTGSREQIVLKSIIYMAEELGMTVICEGVETSAQVDALQKIGCKFAQGFYFYRPMPLHEYESLL